MGVPAARLVRLLVLVMVVPAAQVAQVVLAERALTLVCQPVVMAAAEQMAAAALGRPGLPPLAVTVAHQFLLVIKLAARRRGWNINPAVWGRWVSRVGRRRRQRCG